MEILVKRRQPIADAQPGDLLIDGRLDSYSLERVSRAIPAGRYRLAMTPSARAERKELWSPDPLARLPLVCDVPGRSGIRLHALNEAEESTGCLGVGQRRAGPQILRSRAALMALMERIDAAAGRGEEVWLTIEDWSRADPIRA
jgi:hypothetical protein